MNNSIQQSIPAEVAQDYKDSEIIFIGGGPIGLWTAIQTKLLSGRKITVIEKYHEYKRAEIRLNLSKDSFRGIPKDEQLQNLVKQWGGRQVPIKEMEDALVKRAEELGIRILRGYQADAKQLPEQFPNAELFIDAGGTRSKTRNDIFGEQFQFNTTLQYVAQVQYVIEKKPDINPPKSPIHQSFHKITTLAETYKIQKFAEHLVEQTIRPLENGTSRVTLRIFGLDKETYDQMVGATFSTPYYFERDLDKVPEKLREILIKWWGSQEELNNEVITEDPTNKNKITAIAFGSYASKDAIKMDEKGNIWALVGDSMEAFPYFRAINNGLKLGTRLAQCVDRAFKNQPKPKTLEEKKAFFSYLKSYSRYAFTCAYMERIRAYVKNIFINLFSLWLKISNLVPWQSVKLKSDQKDNLYQRGEVIWERLSGTKPPPRGKKSIFTSLKMKKPSFLSSFFFPNQDLLLS